MEMNSSILVIFSSNDTFRSKRAKVVANCPGIQVPALGIGEEAIFGFEEERHEDLEVN